jgi:hypothetical protein
MNNNQPEELEFYLVANDEKTGKPFVWGFHFPTLESAKRHLLPNTWIIDQHGKEHFRKEAQ